MSCLGELCTCSGRWPPCGVGSVTSSQAQDQWLSDMKLIEISLFTTYSGRPHVFVL